MLAYTNISNLALARRKPVKGAPPAIDRGKVRVIAERRHFSLIIYAVPSERVRALVPASLEVEETIVEGSAMAWVSIESFLDQSAAGHTAFEQTNYRLHVLRDGQPCHWLLGASLGSLAAVGARNLWPMPWHLSAMEFRVAYDKSKGRYREYNLQAQSQWANANWRIEDTGEWISLGKIKALPASLQNPSVTCHFQRRDGVEGRQRMRLLNPAFTRGRVKSAQCDLLIRLGLLNRNQVERPWLVALQHNLSCQFDAPALTNTRFFQAA
ncbi:MAG: DUF2071 domain-containing protein [Acidobacteriota bacterium]|nr:DUF2071 domain-containing protein [Acidobacteriota bacterium]